MFTSALSAGQPYRSPNADERRSGARGFTELVDAGRTDPTALTDLSFSVVDDVDGETGRPYTLAVNEPDSERAWGVTGHRSCHWKACSSSSARAIWSR
jgi:hypothetical protein